MTAQLKQPKQKISYATIPAPTQAIGTVHIRMWEWNTNAAGQLVKGGSNDYTVRQVGTSTFRVRKVSEKGNGEVYTVDVFTDSCDCEGRSAGYNCRHLKVVNKMCAEGKIGE